VYIETRKSEIIFLSP